MTLNERQERMFNKFDGCAKAFCESTGGLFCETFCEYKGEKRTDNLKYKYAKIYFNAFAVGFKYTAHGVLNTVNSILECLVYTDKKVDAVGIPLPIVADYCNVDVAATPLVIPFISDEVEMKQAFDCITGVLVNLLGKISDIVYGEKNGLLLYYQGELENVFSIKIDEEEDKEEKNAFYKSEIFYRFITSRFTSNAYILLMKGDAARAAEALKKHKKLFGYEKRLLNLLQSPQPAFLPERSFVAENLKDFNKKGRPKINPRELFSVFVSWFLLGAVAAVFYTCIFLIVYFFEKRDSVYLMGAIYNFPYCFVGAFLTGIEASYFTRFRFYKLFFRKDYERYLKTEQINRSKKVENLMRLITVGVVTCCLIGCVLFPKQNLKFSEKGFTDNSKLFSLVGKYCGYDEIDCVFYRPDRKNDFGETLNFPSYVLLLKDGKEIDFYEYDEMENYETGLLRFLRDKGVKIVK